MRLKKEAAEKGDYRDGQNDVFEKGSPSVAKAAWRGTGDRHCSRPEKTTWQAIFRKSREGRIGPR